MAIAAKTSAGLVSLPTVTSLAAPIAVAVGDAVVVFVAVHSPDVTVGSVTDTGGNTYTKKGAVVNSDLDHNYIENVDFPEGAYNYIDCEVWTSIATATATSVTANLTGAASVAVAVQSYTGANATPATAFPQVATLAISKTSAAPAISIPSPTSTSFVVAGFASAVLFNQTAQAGTIREQLAAAGRETGEQIDVTDIAASVANTITLSGTPTDAGSPSNPPMASQIGYAVCAVEVHL